MKKKSLKIVAFIVALVLIAGLGLFANSLVGNPVSKALATRTAKQHLKEAYGDKDFYVESVNYSFKTGDYWAQIKSPTSIDSNFSFSLSMSGELQRDDYEDSVLSGWNTWQRLDMEYRELTDRVFESKKFPFEGDICYGQLEKLWPDRDIYEPEVELPDPLEPLVVDKVYDIRELGRNYGELTVYIQDKEVTVERAAEIMLEIKNLMDEQGIPFYIIDFNLQYPRTEDGGVWKEGCIQAINFRYSDIYEEGLVERIETANEAAIAHYAKLDAGK